MSRTKLLISFLCNGQSARMLNLLHMCNISDLLLGMPINTADAQSNRKSIDVYNEWWPLFTKENISLPQMMDGAGKCSRWRSSKPDMELVWGCDGATFVCTSHHYMLLQHCPFLTGSSSIIYAINTAYFIST